MPGVEVGSIVEYRWRETVTKRPIYLKLQFQLEYPIRKVTYFVKPIPIEFRLPDVRPAIQLPAEPAETRKRRVCLDQPRKCSRIS